MLTNQKNKGITIIANLISLLVSIFISFFITKYIVEYIGKEAYSFYPTANNFATYFSIIFLATNALTSRFVMIPYLKGDIKEAQSYYSTSFISCIVLSVVVFLIELFFYFNLENILDIPSGIVSDVKLLFLFIFLSSLVCGIGSIFTCVFYIKDRMDLYALSTIVENLIKGIVIFILMILNKISLVSFGLIIFIASFIRYLLTFFFSIRCMKEIRIKISSFSFEKLKKIMKLGSMSMISNSCNILIVSSELIVSNILLGIEASSELSLVQAFVTVCLLLNNIITVMVEPMQIRCVIDDNKEDNLKYINYMMLALLYIPTVMIACLSRQFYCLWLPSENYNVLYVLSLLSCIQILMSNISFFYSSAISTFLKEKYKAIGVLIAICIYVLLLYIFIYKMNLNNMGIMYAGLISYGLYFVIYIPLIAKKLFKENGKSLHLGYIKNLLFIVTLIIINVLLCNIFKNGSTTNFLLMCMLALVINYLLMLIVYKVNIKEFLTFIK